MSPLPANVCEAALTAAMQEVARCGHLDDLNHDNAAGVGFDLAIQLAEFAARRALMRAKSDESEDDGEESPAA